jgi:hypothetical protein
MRVSVDQLDSSKRILVPGSRTAHGFRIRFSTSSVTGAAILIPNTSKISTIIPKAQINVTAGFERLAELKLVPIAESEHLTWIAGTYDYEIRASVFDVSLSGDCVLKAKDFTFPVQGLTSDQLPQDFQLISCRIHGVSLWMR